nr:hypothetical protein [uncultured Sphingosinicella sp.]
MGILLGVSCYSTLLVDKRKAELLVPNSALSYSAAAVPLCGRLSDVGVSDSAAIAAGKAGAEDKGFFVPKCVNFMNFEAAASVSLHV